MTNIDLIFEDEFKKSKAYKEWHESYISAIKHALEPTKEFISNWEAKYGKLSELGPIKDDDPWAIKTKEEILTLRNDLLIKSIELGLFFREFEEKRKMSKIPAKQF
ncbi:hypothetical protein [Methanobacterium sp. MBAC-LM]|uniref:hypothetical protein n=1 Tax=Methanobacterium sp. MBAC-LM TaxID=3412034 RepID=UPI003C7397B2